MALIAALIICLIGLLVYVASASGKVQSVALHCFWVGLFVFLLRWGGAALK